MWIGCHSDATRICWNYILEEYTEHKLETGKFLYLDS